MDQIIRNSARTASLSLSLSLSFPLSFPSHPLFTFERGAGWPEKRLGLVLGSICHWAHIMHQTRMMIIIYINNGSNNNNNNNNNNGTTDLYDVLLRLIHTAVLPRLDEGEYVGAKNRAVHMICIFPLLPYSLPTLCF